MQCSYMEEKSIFLVTGCSAVEHILCFMDINMDNKKFGLHLRKRRKTLVQTVKVVLGLVSLLWSKTCGSVCRNT